MVNYLIIGNYARTNSIHHRLRSLFPIDTYQFLIGRNKGYFRDSALTLDKLANREFRTLWNKTLITEAGYLFGNIEETISAVLGHNIKRKTLTKTGKALVFILTKKHCLDAIV